MKSIPTDNFVVPAFANFVQQGSGVPVVMIHGIAASLHDWDELSPSLTPHGYATYALDLLGHGESPKPELRAYQMDWLLAHFEGWMRSLQLSEPAIIIGHSLGGYIALDYVRRFAHLTRGLILVNPFYSRSQLPLLLRRSYSSRNLRGVIVSKTPEWLFRAVVDVTSRALGHSAGAIHSLPAHIRAQTALDYTRTAPGVYNIPNVLTDLTEHLPTIKTQTLVVWGDRDQTLAPASFPKLVSALPHAQGRALRASHVPHQSNSAEFNALVLDFLRGLEQGQ